MSDNFSEIFKNVKKVDFERIVSSYTSKNQNNDIDFNIGKGIIFKQFSSLESVFEKIEEVRDENKKKHNKYKQSAIDAVSSPEYNNYKSMMESFNYESVSNKEAKKSARSVIENAKDLINLGGSFKKSKLKITSDERGMFDFSLASQGLFRPLEYYNEEIGLVEESLVDNYKVNDENIFFTKVGGVEYVLERRQKGTTDVFSKFSNLCLLKTDSNGVVLPYLKSDTNKVFNGEGENKLKYASSNKKSYLMYEKQSDSAKYIDFYVPVNYLMSGDATMILNVLYVLIISSILEQFDIRTRITAVRHGVHNGVAFEFLSVVLKDYSDTTEDRFNIVLNVLGQSSVAGSFFGFLAIYYGNFSGQKDSKGNTIKTNGSKVRLEPIIYPYRNLTDSFFNRFKNWSKTDGNASVEQSKVLDDNFKILTIQNVIGANPLFFNDISTLDSNAIKNNLGYTMFLVYFYLDYIAIEKNPLPYFVSELNKRFSEDDNFQKLFNLPKDKKERKDIVREYVLGILTRKYGWNKDGLYADTQLQIDEKNRIFKEKLNVINESLNKIYGNN